MNCGERKTRDGHAALRADRRRPLPGLARRHRARQRRRRQRAGRRRRHRPRPPAHRRPRPGHDEHAHGRLHRRRPTAATPTRPATTARTRFSIFDLADLEHPVEVDSDPAEAGTQPFALADRRPQVELRRRRLRHPHRLRRLLDLRRQRPGAPAAGHHDRCGGAGRRPGVPGLQRLHPPQLLPAERQGVHSPTRRRPWPTATSCWSPRRTTSRPTAARRAPSRPGGSSGSTAPRTRSCRWTRSSSPTSAPSRCREGAFCSAHWFSTSTRRASSRPASTAAAPS